ncbi:hypothetical protein HZR84_14335 [Hyphobacterium sp. CCMP332]|nr:hypothetical protein HZR84_14335 [Hyphobacterium sp. CCMP332]
MKTYNGLKRLGFYQPDIVNELNIYDNDIINSEGEEPTSDPQPFIGEYLYELRDHQENVRLVFMPTLNGPEIINAKDYYSFGLSFNDFSNLEYNHGYQGLYTRFELMSHLVEFEARPFDPVIGRWLMTDPRNQFESPYNGMGNQPFMLVDPSGEEAVTLTATMVAIKITKVILGAAAVATAAYTTGVAFSPGGFNNWDWNQLGKQVAISAAMALATYGIGSAYAGIYKEAAKQAGHAIGINTVLEVNRALAHATSSAFINLAFTGDLSMSTYASSAIGSFSGHMTSNAEVGLTYAASTLSGGISSELSGGKFWDGVRNAAIITTFNYMMHRNGDPEKDEGFGDKVARTEANSIQGVRNGIYWLKHLFSGNFKFGGIELEDDDAINNINTQTPDHIVVDRWRALGKEGILPSMSLWHKWMLEDGWEDTGKFFLKENYNGLFDTTRIYSHPWKNHDVGFSSNPNKK